MPLQIDTSGPLTVTSADARSVNFIISAGGRLINHGEFIHVFIPAGTKRRKVTPARKERSIRQDAPYTLYKLPTGAILTLCQHSLSYDEDDQEGAPAW